MSPDNPAVLMHRVGAVENDLRDHKTVAFRKFDELNTDIKTVNRDIAQISAKVAGNVAIIGLVQVLLTGILLYYFTRGS